MVDLLIKTSKLLLSFLFITNQVYGLNIGSNDEVMSINHYSNLDPAYSAGSLGLKLGVAYENIEWNQDPIANRQVYQSLDRSSGNIEFIKLQLSKGTRWPIDFSIQASQGLDSDISKVGGQAQWTILQGFKIPSLAVRAGAMKTFGLRSTELSGYHAGVIVDYSAFSYFTLFYSIESQYHHLKVSRKDEPLQLNISQLKDSKSNYQNSSIGLLIRAWPGVGDLRIAKHSYYDKNRYSFQLSFGI